MHLFALNCSAGWSVINYLHKYTHSAHNIQYVWSRLSINEWWSNVHLWVRLSRLELTVFTHTAHAVLARGRRQRTPVTVRTDECQISQFGAINVLERDFMMRHDTPTVAEFNWTVKSIKNSSRSEFKWNLSPRAILPHDLILDSFFLIEMLMTLSTMVGGCCCLRFPEPFIERISNLLKRDIVVRHREAETYSRRSEENSQ